MYMPVFTFSNTDPIQFECSDDLRISYPAKPYPSHISVFALPSNIADIAVHLYGLQADLLDELTILLVAPDHSSNLVLLNAINNGANPQPSVDISIIDHSPLMSQSDRLVNDSSYHPTSYYPHIYPSPGPSPPYDQPPVVANATFFSSFISPRIKLDGVWSLYVFSSGTRISSFSIADGWSISFYTKYNE
jgi:hypothetical protein